MAYNIFNYGPTGRSIFVDNDGMLVVSNDPTASGYVLGYGDEGFPVLVDASGKLLIQNDSPTNSLAQLSDTDVVGAVSGQFLMYDSSVGDWVPSDVMLELDELSDVITTAPSVGDRLVYDGNNWVNQGVADIDIYSVQLVQASGQILSATAGKTYSCNLSGGSMTVEMPASPNTNDHIVIKDKGNSQQNYITVDGNGNNIDGQASRVLQSNYAAFTLVWDSQEWIIV